MSITKIDFYQNLHRVFYKKRTVISNSLKKKKKTGKFCELKNRKDLNFILSIGLNEKFNHGHAIMQKILFQSIKYFNSG